MNISVIGSGYVGLVTATCLAEFGLFVYGKVPIYEPGLEEMVNRNMRDGRLNFSTDLASAVKNSLVIFIAVGTPEKEDGSADLQYVEEAAREVARNMNGYKVIVDKSTVPVGTGQKVKQWIRESQPQPYNFDVVSNPEFLREGSAIGDFMRPNRVVIGAESEQAFAIMKDIYNALYLIETPFVLTNIETAEIIKYASNAFLATKISFINEIANLCDAVGADVHDVAKGMGLDNRIGRLFLHPGPGFGGSCFPKDTKALVKIATQYGVKASLVEAVIKANENQRKIMVEKIKAMVGDLAGKTIGVLGLAFKPNTDDIRESPAIYIIKDLLAEKAVVKAYDPEAMQEAKKVLPNVHFCNDAYEVPQGANALVFLTEWNQFRKMDLERIKKSLKEPVIIDLRNIYEPEEMCRFGFRYCGVGRGSQAKGQQPTT